MAISDWSRSELEYGRKVLNSGLEGARSGQGEFLNGESLAPFIRKAALSALKPAAVGACMGILGGYRRDRHNSIGRILGYGFVGSLIGFASGVAWESRDLTSSVAGSALKSIGKVSDEHWLEKHPIDYA